VITVTDCDQDYGLAPVKMFKDQIVDLNFHVADTEMIVGRDEIVKYTAMLASVVYRWGTMICGGASDKPDVTAIRTDTDATMCRRYLRAVRQLNATLDYLVVIGDTFEAKRPDPKYPLPVEMLGGVRGGVKSYARRYWRKRSARSCRCSSAD
jgi:hypothetical protein